MTLNQSPKQKAFAVDVNRKFDIRGEIILDKDAIIASLSNIMLGYMGCKSRIFDQTFGSLVYDTLGQPLDNITASQLRGAILQAVLAHEPRVVVNLRDVTVIPNQEIAGFQVSIRFRVKATNQTYSQSFNLRSS